ncbi:MAG: hypothetical protein WEB04_07740 [Dehalococcoidia bacterium]
MRRGRATRRGRRRFAARPIALALSVLAVLAGAAVAWTVLRSDDGGDGGPPRAAIVDQLSVNLPNAEFIEQATATLEGAGYIVDYYSGEQTDVEFYRRLPVLDYDVLVFRNHADRLQAIEPNGQQFDEVILFTSEPYERQRYIDDQAANRLVIASYAEGDTETFFGISSRFIKDGMIGEFDGTTVIMMGCEGLLNDSTARAFIDRGAKTYISWDETVSVQHTDAAGERLLDLLYTNGLSATAAVDQTMAELGPDPAFGSSLLAYPPGS